MTKIIAVVVAIGLSVPASAADSPVVTADSVRAKMNRSGPAETLRVLVQTDTLESLTSGVASGDMAWLEVAASLRLFAAPNADLGLDYAAGHGLLKAPMAVLRLVGAGFTAEHVCDLSFWGPEPGQARRYVQEAEAALARVKDPRLEALAKQCISRIRANGELNY